jgi:Transglycosylase SLT domain
MILHSFRKRAAIHWFDRRLHHSSFPAKSKASIAPNIGPTTPLEHRLAGQSSGLRDCALSQREPGTPARFCHVEIMVCLIGLVTLSVVSFSFVASAGKAKLNGAAGSNTWAPYIAEAAHRFSVPAHWIRAVMQLESNGNTIALSPKGAMGLMQIMPQTYAELRLRYHLGPDPYARAAIFWLARPICASCRTAMDPPDFWPPIMSGRDDMRTISRTGDHCLRRRAIMSPHSLL